CAEHHVAAGAGETVEVESLHNGGVRSPTVRDGKLTDQALAYARASDSIGRISAAFPVRTSSHKSDRGVASGFSCKTYAPAARAISGIDAEGYTTAHVQSTNHN